VFAKGKKNWKTQAQFEKLLRWTKTASPNELAALAEDPEGKKTYAGGLLASILN